MTRVTADDTTGAIGVTIVQFAIEQELNWIFRRVEHRDKGLDATVEITIDGQATGMLVGLQIKSGSSYFKEATKDGWRYRGNYDHLEYWRHHRLPVAIVLVDIEHQHSYWQPISDQSSIHEAGKSWTITIPAEKRLGKETAEALMEFAWHGNPIEGLCRYCQVHRDYIYSLAENKRVSVDVGQWVNKVGGRAEVSINVTDHGGRLLRSKTFMMMGARDAVDFVTRFAPWAHVSIDQERHGTMTGDLEELEVHGELEPYIVEAGEVARWRFLLTLNDVGRAFNALRLAAPEQRAPPYFFARELESVLGKHEE